MVALEEKSLAVRCRELKLEKELQRALESHSHMQAQLKSLAHDRGELIARLHALQVRIGFRVPGSFLTALDARCSMSRGRTLALTEQVCLLFWRMSTDSDDFRAVVQSCVVLRLRCA